MNPPGEGAMEAVDKARSHPLRRQILLAMAERDRPLAPVEFGEIVGMSSSHVAYHFTKLEDAGLIDLKDTGQRRGAVVHFYAPSKLFTAELKDAAALDRIADLLDGAEDVGEVDVKAIARAVFASGRPVIGGEG